MEIDRNIYNQYRDTPFKIEETTNTKKNIFLIGKKIKNPNMDEYAKYVMENTQEIEPSKNKKTTYNIILRTSYDKTKHLEDKTQEGENSLLNNKSQDVSNIDTTKACSKTDITLKLKMPKNTDDNNDIINQKKEKEDNKDNINMIVEEENDNNSKEINNKDNKIYKNKYEKEEENKNNKYYNPFNAKNMYENENIKQKKIETGDIDNEKNNKKEKLPNITLTTFPLPIKKNEEKISKFSRFLNIFSSKKKDKNKNNELKIEEKDDDKKKELKTLEQQIIEDNIIVNENKKDKEQEDKKNEKINEKNNIKYDFVLGVVPSKKDKNEKNEKEDNNGMKEYIKENNEIGFSERQNIYEAENELKNIQDNNKSITYIINAEPIINNDNKEDSIEAQSNLDNSSKMSDYDKSSIFTFLSNSKFSQLIKENSKYSALLLAILLGSCGLFYLAYKKLKLREIISKLGETLKVIPGFFNYILSFIGAGIEDFLERYDDTCRLLVGIITIICIWFLFKLLMKKFMKRKK